MHTMSFFWNDARSMSCCFCYAQCFCTYLPEGLIVLVSVKLQTNHLGYINSVQVPSLSLCFARFPTLSRKGESIGIWEGRLFLSLFPKRGILQGNFGRYDQSTRLNWRCSKDHEQQRFWSVVGILPRKRWLAQHFYHFIFFCTAVWSHFGNSNV